MRPDLDTPRYFFSDLSKAVRVEQNTLKAWLARKSIWLTQGDREAEGAGSRRLLTLRTIYVVAVTAELVRLGLSPARSHLVARQLSENTDRLVLGGFEHFVFGEFEPRGLPYIVVYENPDAQDLAKKTEGAPGEAVRTRFLFEDESTDFLEKIFRGGVETVAAIVNCSAILSRVDKALGLARAGDVAGDAA